MDDAEDTEDNKVEEIIPGSEIIQNMLDNNINLMPATIDTYMRKGPALYWYKCGNARFDMSQYHDFSKQKGHKEGRQMCSLTMTNNSLCGIYCKATKEWLCLHPHCCFGPTYRDEMPSTNLCNIS
eukprot:4843560-Ditylum_brightwellii.AAC.1